MQSEYVSVRDKRREFVSGFSGSAGIISFFFRPSYQKMEENLDFIDCVPSSNGIF